MNTAFWIHLILESKGLTGNFLTFLQLLCVVKIPTVTLTSQLPLCCTQEYFFSGYHFCDWEQGFRELYTFEKLSILAPCYCAAVLYRWHVVPIRQVMLSVLEPSCTCDGLKAPQSEWENSSQNEKERYCPVLNLCYTWGKKRQASGHASLSSESVFKAKRKVGRSGSGLTGAVNEIIWAQQFLTTVGRKHSAYWEGEDTEGEGCCDGAPFLTPMSSFLTALSYPEAPYIIVLQVQRNVPNKNKEGKISGPFPPLVIPGKCHGSDTSGLCKHSRWMCVYSSPQLRTISHNSFVIMFFREFVKQNGPS